MASTLILSLSAQQLWPLQSNSVGGLPPAPDCWLSGLTHIEAAFSSEHELCVMCHVHAALFHQNKWCFFYLILFVKPGLYTLASLPCRSNARVLEALRQDVSNQNFKESLRGRWCFTLYLECHKQTDDCVTDYVRHVLERILMSGECTLSESATGGCVMMAAWWWER